MLADQGGLYVILLVFVLQLRPEISIEITSQDPLGQKGHVSTRETLKVALLSSRWSSSAGGLSTLNRELAIHLAQHPKVEVSLLVPEGTCKDEDKREAQSYGVTVVDAKKRPGYELLDWLSFPPKDHRMDIVVGHGVKLGRQVQIIKDSAHFSNCKCVQVVHAAPGDLSRYKSFSDLISKCEKKHQVEVDLCKMADLVVPVGPRLEDFYSSYLRRCKENQDIFTVTPDIFEREFGDLKQAPNESGELKVLLCGRGDDEDFQLKRYNIAVEAFSDPWLKSKPYHLIFVGASEGKQEQVREKLLQRDVPEEQLTVRKFVQNREKMKDLLNEVHLAIMPSRSEGFNLVALEALSAGLPILVGSKSGFARALENIPYGKSWIVYSDDPTKWAEAIESVRASHAVRLEEIKLLRASYDNKYSWKEQREAFVEIMCRMVPGMSSYFVFIVSIPKVTANLGRVTDTL